MNTIIDHLKGYLINDTLKDCDIYALPVKKETVELFPTQLERLEAIIVKKVKIKKQNLLLCLREYNSDFAKVAMPDKISRSGEEGREFKRKFFYTREPLNSNHIAPKNSNVQGHYGNVHIPSTLVCSTELQFEMLKRLLNTDYVLIIKTDK